MIELDDVRWIGLNGGYRIPYDPRPALRKLASGRDIEAAWKELWNELHHQGDVGEVSYLAVPQMVHIHLQRGVADWNTYALVAAIEDARQSDRNPKLPAWLQETYFVALRALSEIGLNEFRQAHDTELINSIIAILAMAKGEHLLGRFAIAFTEDERAELLELYG